MINQKIIESYINSGLHLIPLQPDKSPVPRWKWKDIIPTAEDLRGMPGDYIGMACGNGVEVIDFDLKYDHTSVLFDQYCQMVEHIAPDLLGSLLFKKQ